MHHFPEKKDYPKDFFYHRTSSPTYRKYLEGCGLTLFDFDHPPQFAWKKKIFGNYFGIVKFERVDHAPDIDLIKKKTGLKHAFVVWIPYSKTKNDIPPGWRRLWFTDHFEETGFAELSHHGGEGVKDEGSGNSEKNNGTPGDAGLPRRFLTDTEKSPRNDNTNEWLASWNDRSKRALKKFEKSGCRVESVTPEVFAQAFRATKVKHWHKSVYIGYYKKMVAIHPESVRQWVAYNSEGIPLAGLAVHDYLDTHSVHLVAFTNQKYYHTQAGTGVMGEWFRDSKEKGLKYLTVDHIRNRTGPNDQKGYTEFKENFITTRLSFREAYFTFY